MDELAFQIAFESVYPYGDVRLEYMIAQLTAALIAVYTPRGGSVPDLLKLMLSEQLEASTREQSQDEIDRMIDFLFSKPETLQ